MLSAAFLSGGWLVVTRAAVREFLLPQSPGSEPMSFVYGVVDLAPRELLGDAFLMK